MNPGWPVRIVTFAVWALAAAGAMQWALRFSAAPAAPRAAVAAPGSVSADSARVARLLGASATAAPAAMPGPAPAPGISLASRFALHGIAAGAENRRAGVAVIAVDGKPPRPYAAGTRLDEGVWVQAIEPRRVVLSASRDGPPLLSLELSQRR